jgi:pimeloyl-ACP methyl ester carboxylesterase
MEAVGKVEEIIEEHRAAGRGFEAGGIRSFVREQGEGDPVVLVHGVPTSSYLWRKVLPRLADGGLRGVAFDFPGLGFAQRPEDFGAAIARLAAQPGR